MAIYHLSTTIITRSTGRTAIGAAAYMSCSEITSEYDGIHHNYTRKQGLVFERIFLPDCAPAAWADRATLWNAVEKAEKAKDSRLARLVILALPVELNREQQIQLLSKYVEESFVEQGMCADACIHDTDGHNPHAHIMLTVRPLNPDGTWQKKTEKEYLCARDGEEGGFTAAEFVQAQQEGWEKQYPYQVGKKKVYMTSSEAQEKNLVRASKNPKCTRYGRQNPISERWNSEEQLLAWREAWATAANQALEQNRREERIDHRSHAARGLDEQPTIHEGVEAQAMERKGFVSDRCELNRQIRRDNVLLRELKVLVASLVEAAKNAISILAEKLAAIWQRMVELEYLNLELVDEQAQVRAELKPVLNLYNEYMRIEQEIGYKKMELSGLQEQRKKLPITELGRRRKLGQEIDAKKDEIQSWERNKAYFYRAHSDLDEEKMRGIEKQVQAGSKRLEVLIGTKRNNQGILQKLETQYQEAMQGSEIPNNDDFKEALIHLREEKQEQLEQRLKTQIGGRLMTFRFTEAIQRVAVRLGEIASREGKETRRTSVISILKDMESKPGNGKESSRGKPVR